LLLLAAAASASLTSCNGGDSSLAAMGAGRHAPNATDAIFVGSMTANARTSLGITRLAQQRALRSELRGIARTMTGEQQGNLDELDSLEQSLAGRGLRPPAARRRPSTALSDLAVVKDATSFDHEFMRTMIERNEEAIAMARHEVSFGSDPEAKRLAAAIVASRKKELEKLLMWLHLWYGGDVQPGPPRLKPPGGGGGQKPGPPPPTPHKVPL
jgi:uncharacterized protein (DUF305 family)